MGLISWIFLGLIAGSLAQTTTGFRKRGCLFTMFVGIVGAFVGGALFSFLGSKPVWRFSLASAFVAFIGACALCIVLKAVERRH